MAFPKIDKSRIDDMHFDQFANKLLSYNKPKICCLSARELGKSTWAYLFLYRRCVEQGETFILFKYRQCDVMDVTIDDIGELISKFTYEPVKLWYKRGTLKEGVCDVYLWDEEEDKKIRFFRLVVINLPKNRLKSLFYPGLRWTLFDEYMLDTRAGDEETYPNGCVMKLNEIFKTFNRETDGKLRMLFFGNPYSRSCPIHNFIGVKASQLKIGEYAVGDDYVAAVIPLPQKLIDHILERDKNYKFDENYLMYSIYGKSINDEQIRILESEPKNYILRYVFYIEGQKLLVYRNNNDVIDSNNIYWITVRNEYTTTSKNIYTFDYNSLVEGTVLMSNDDRMVFTALKNCFRFRKIQFGSVESEYLFEQIYDTL